MKGIKFNYTEEQLAWLEQHKALNRQLLTDTFNAQFGVECTIGSIKALCIRKKWKAENNGRFKVGQTYNPKTRPPKGHTNAGSFKKGRLPLNSKNIGKVRYSKDSIEIKCAQPKGWVNIRHAVFESFYGEVPDGCFVTSLDGNRFNIDPTNLECVDRATNAAISKYRSKNKEITRAFINLKRLHLTATEREKKCQLKQLKDGSTLQCQSQQLKPCLCK